jgi:hypothetical protein
MNHIRGRLSMARKATVARAGAGHTAGPDTIRAVAQLSPSQVRWRGRIETGLRFAAPVLDLVLAAGDRLSRVGDREQPELLLSTRLGHDDQRTLTHGRD